MRRRSHQRRCPSVGTVTVAVLLDNFVAETARERGNEKDLELEAMRSKDQMGNVLDPLLKVLANEYIDKGDLDNFLTVLFHNLDADSSGALNRPPPPTLLDSNLARSASLRTLRRACRHSSVSSALSSNAPSVSPLPVLQPLQL